MPKGVVGDTGNRESVSTPGRMGAKTAILTWGDVEL